MSRGINLYRRFIRQTNPAAEARTPVAVGQRNSGGERENALLVIADLVYPSSQPHLGRLARRIRLQFEKVFFPIARINEPTPVHLGRPHSQSGLTKTRLDPIRKRY